MNLKMLVATFVLVFSICVVSQETALQSAAVDRLIARLENNSNTIAVPTLNIDLLSLVRLAAKDEVKEACNKLKQESQAAWMTRNPYPTSHLDTLELGGKKYFFSKKQHMTWIDAVSYCRLYGMELASIETRAEDQLITTHLKSIGLGEQSYVLISGNKIGRSSYIWMNGEPLVYENWYPDNPSDFAKKHCMSHYKGGWTDHYCGNSDSFICEQP